MLFIFVTDNHQSLRKMSSARHRIQNPEHHISNNLQRGGGHPAGQVQDEAPRPETLLLEHGGNCEESRRSNSSTFR